jgi:glutamate dehydrogenase (NAD(P)+)
MGCQFEVHVHDGDVRGFLVVDRAICDRACGGLRIVRDLAVEEVREQAQLMTNKFGVLGIACGGAKAGLVSRPEWGPAEKRDALQRMGRALAPLLRRGLYITGEDMGCDQRDLWAFRHGAQLVAGDEPATPDLRRTSGYYAGVGAALAAGAALGHLGRTVAGSTVAIEGFGRVGRAAAAEFVRRGGRLRCASNAYGAITAESLHPTELIEFLNQHGEAAIGDFPNARRLPREALFAEAVDVIIPCARPAAIHGGNVGELRCSVVAPGGNCSVTEEAQALLHERGIVSVPDFVANSGGVLVSHFAPLLPSPHVADWLLNTSVPAVAGGVLRTARARKQPPITVARDLVAHNLNVTCRLREPPPHEAWLQRLGGLRLRRLIPEAAEWMLVHRLAHGLLRAATALESPPQRPDRIRLRVHASRNAY